MKSMILAAAAVATLAACSSSNDGNSAQPGRGAQVTGAGSTFVYPVLAAWASEYQKQAGTSINYQSIGSGGGI